MKMGITKQEKTVEKVLQDIIAMTERICADDDNISDWTLDGIDRIKRMAKEALETNQITILEWLQNANIQELAEVLSINYCPFPPICDKSTTRKTCIQHWKTYLESDAGEDGKRLMQRLKKEGKRIRR